MTAVIIAIVAGVVLAVIVVAVWLRRSHRVESGVDRFRRHIDALSPEARREVADRVKRQRDEADED